MSGINITFLNIKVRRISFLFLFRRVKRIWNLVTNFLVKLLASHKFFHLKINLLSCIRSCHTVLCSRQKRYFHWNKNVDCHSLILSLQETVVQF